MKARRAITGTIYSDLGEAASFMSLEWVQNLLRERLGFSPYPATLNLRIETEGEMGVWREIKKEMKGITIEPADPSYCAARCFLVAIEGKEPGAVLLPDVEGYPPNKVEVISPVRLKDALGVKDGERITLEFLP